MLLIFFYHSSPGASSTPSLSHLNIAARQLTSGAHLQRSSKEVPRNRKQVVTQTTTQNDQKTTEQETKEAIQGVRLSLICESTCKRWAVVVKFEATQSREKITF